MTRIISGVAGSIALTVPGAGTRPTSDRVRESLFGALEAAGDVEGARVLDLYAGSGALALEAVSRGAVSADLVERSPGAAAVAGANARAVSRAAPQAAVRVHRSTAAAFLRAASQTYDLVFVDPPYDLGETDLAEILALASARTSPHAWIIVERAARSPEPAAPEGFEVARSRRYGDTALWWLARGEDAAPADPDCDR